MPSTHSKQGGPCGGKQSVPPTPTCVQGWHALWQWHLQQVSPPGLQQLLPGWLASGSRQQLTTPHASRHNDTTSCTHSVHTQTGT
jgi:hypothetical protein